MEEVTVLQVGMKNLSKVYIIPRNVRWVYIQSGQLTKEKLKSLEVKKIQCTIVDFITPRDLSLLIEKVEAWTLFFTENVFLLSDIPMNCSPLLPPSQGDFLTEWIACVLKQSTLKWQRSIKILRCGVETMPLKLWITLEKNTHQ